MPRWRRRLKFDGWKKNICSGRRLVGITIGAIAGLPGCMHAHHHQRLLWKVRQRWLVTSTRASGTAFANKGKRSSALRPFMLPDQTDSAHTTHEPASAVLFLLLRRFSRLLSFLPLGPGGAPRPAPFPLLPVIPPTANADTPTCRLCRFSDLRATIARVPWLPLTGTLARLGVHGRRSPHAHSKPLLCVLLWRGRWRGRRGS